MSTCDPPSDNNGDWWSSWKDAHSRTCRSRNALFATPQQVLDYTQTTTNDNRLILWSLPRRDAVIEWNSSERVEAVCKPAAPVVVTTPTKSQPQTEPETPAPSKGVFQYVTEAVFSPLLGALTPSKPQYDTDDEEDDALKSWDSITEEEDDDAYRTTTGKTSSKSKSSSDSVAWDVPILDVNLAQECLGLLGSALASQPASETAFPKIIPRRRTASGYSWLDWVQENTQNNKLLSSLSDSEMDFLLECLSRTEKITLISREGKEDLIALAPPLQDGTSDTYKQVLAAWFELTVAQEGLETRREQWCQQAEEFARKALQEKRQHTITKRGLASFKLHKLYVQKLEESEGQLLNLEQARHAVEESWHRRQVVQALETSTQTLQSLREQGNKLEDVDNLMETYREEIEHMSEVQQSLSATDTAFDEEDLLKELESLTLQDNDPPAPPRQGGSTEGKELQSSQTNAETTEAETKAPTKITPMSSKEETPKPAEKKLVVAE